MITPALCSQMVTQLQTLTTLQVQGSGDLSNDDPQSITCHHNELPPPPPSEANSHRKQRVPLVTSALMEDSEQRPVILVIGGISAIGLQVLSTWWRRMTRHGHCQVEGDSVILFLLLKVRVQLWHICFYGYAIFLWRTTNIEQPTCETINPYNPKLQRRVVLYICNSLDSVLYRAQSGIHCMG